MKSRDVCRFSTILQQNWSTLMTSTKDSPFLIPRLQSLKVGCKKAEKELMQLFPQLPISRLKIALQKLWKYRRIYERNQNTPRNKKLKEKIYFQKEMKKFHLMQRSSMQ